MNNALRMAGLAAICAGGVSSALAFDPASQAKGIQSRPHQLFRCESAVDRGYDPRRHDAVCR
mgnify:CR=1 FL=1